MTSSGCGRADVLSPDDEGTNKNERKKTQHVWKWKPIEVSYSFSIRFWCRWKLATIIVCVCVCAGGVVLLSGSGSWHCIKSTHKRQCKRVVTCCCLMNVMSIAADTPGFRFLIVRHIFILQFLYVFFFAWLLCFVFACNYITINLYHLHQFGSVMNRRLF